MMNEEKNLEYFCTKMDKRIQPRPVKKPFIKSGEVNPEVIRAHADAMESYNEEKKSYDKKREEYFQDRQQVHNDFKEWALQQCDISNHEKAEAAWVMAWDRAHSCGLQEVYDELEELSNLMT